MPTKVQTVKAMIFPVVMYGCESWPINFCVCVFGFGIWVTNLDSILKSRDITLPAKVRLVKAMVFPVVMYGCESRTVKKAECQKIDVYDAFELWCWRRLLMKVKEDSEKVGLNSTFRKLRSWHLAPSFHGK